MQEKAVLCVCHDVPVLITAITESSVALAAPAGGAQMPAEVVAENGLAEPFPTPSFQSQGSQSNLRSDFKY